MTMNTPFRRIILSIGLLLLGSQDWANAQEQPGNYDASLAKRLGADTRGMRKYVLVILKTGPNKVPAGPERDAMFVGHFANMQRLSDAGKLVLAGPFDGSEAWRGLFIFAVDSIDEARELTATDPVIVKGEMIAELHPWYGSAAVMEIPNIHSKLMEKKSP